MDGDEAFALLLSVVLGAYAAWRWYAPIIRVTPMARTSAQRLALAVFPIGCLAFLLFVLTHWADVEVRDTPVYIVLFAAAGAAWMGAAAALLAILGLSVRDDAIERRNPAATIAAIAILMATTLAYAGANIGSGPTIWTTFGPAVLATAALFALVLFVELIAQPLDTIAMERDVASALRFAAFIVAAGAVLGRAVAGNWQSTQATLEDFAQLGWPAIALAVAMCVLQIAFRPTPGRPSPSAFFFGLIPSLLIVASGAAWLVHVGRWE